MQHKGTVKFINKEKSVFYPTLTKRVDAYFRENNISKFANRTMVLKTIALLLVYLLPFVVLITLQPPFWVSLILWFIMAIGVGGIGMSIMHDGNHGAYSSNRHINYITGHMANLLGASAFNWKLQHNVLHHTFTNVTHMDEDIDDKLSMLRFSPHTPVYRVHRLQWLYAFVFYGIPTLYWVTVKDFVQFIKHIRSGVNTHSKAKNIGIITKISLVKVVYFFVFMVLPVFILGMSFLEVLAGFVLMHVVAGVLITLIFQLAHTVEGTDHPLPNENGVIENDWAIHQMRTTANFAPHNKWLSWYIGGLNYQIEHHLFPGISHVHYPKIAPIVKETAEEFNIPYVVNPTFWDAVRSHIATLKRFGQMPHLDEAIG